VSFVPRSNERNSRSSRCYGPGRWVPTASRGIRRALARTPPSTSSGFVWPYPRYCYHFGVQVLEPSLAPTSSFRTTSPVCAATRFAGLLHPAADPGVRYVSTRLSVEPAPKARPLLDVLPAGHRRAVSSHRVSHPSKEFPSPQPHRIAATVASSDFSSSPIRDSVAVAVSSAVNSCRIGGTWSLEALLRGGVRTFCRLMQTTKGLSFLGLVPLRGFLTLEPCDSSGMSEAPCTSTVPRMRVPFAPALVPSVVVWAFAADW
jgi:hypothetical protein